MLQSNEEQQGKLHSKRSYNFIIRRCPSIKPSCIELNRQSSDALSVLMQGALRGPQEES